MFFSNPQNKTDGLNIILDINDSFVHFDILKKKKAFFDLDGTVYLGNRFIEGAVKLFEQLRKNGVAYYFLSNNSSKIKSQYLSFINHNGIYCTEENIILPTEQLLEQLIRENIDEVFLIGTNALAGYFKSKGINPESKNPAYVVVAFDNEMTYEKLQKATIFIQQGVPYLATNIDMVCPTDKGNIPDTGAICQLLESCTGIRPQKIFGKPNPSLIEPYIKNVDIEDVVIIGDRLYTDMALAKAVNCDFVLTLTGEAKEQHLPSLDYEKCSIVSSIGELII